MISLVTFCSLFLISHSTRASNLEPSIIIGGEYGGRNLKQLSSQPLQQNLAAGAGFLIAGGITYHISPTYPHAFQARLTAGFNYWWKEAPEGQPKASTSWKSIPLELQYFYENKRNSFRAGYGLTYRASNYVFDQGGGSDKNIRFNNALGYTFAIEKYVSKPTGVNLGVGLRYTIINYKESASGQIINGDSIGIYYVLGGSIKNEPTEVP